MQWAYYLQNIVQCYMVHIQCWPKKIIFTNLSSVSSALPDLKMLLWCWESGTTSWQELLEEEYELMHREWDAQLLSVVQSEDKEEEGRQDQQQSSSGNLGASAGPSHMPAPHVSSDSGSIMSASDQNIIDFISNMSPSDIDLLLSTIAQGANISNLGS
ncbi:hypothetical protein HYDPIDRAFT_166258 [Hydnomerulius pinastri MD-312]|nr:hypothetical protein HYDPIDRAFT_166258 [Hydnomerulius pinastri MD-312]